jgi:steroid delta-isomerase-like uncharacterized protein
MAHGDSDLLQRWFDSIWNQGRVEVADELLAPGAILHETAVGSDATQTADDFKTMARVLRRAIPDIKFRVDQTVQSGDLAVARLTVTGTHSGPGLGFPASGRSFRITGMAMIRLSGDRTVEGWSNFDMLGLYEQLGAVKRPTIGADL